MRNWDLKLKRWNYIDDIDIAQLIREGLRKSAHAMTKAQTF